MVSSECGSRTIQCTTCVPKVIGSEITILENAREDLGKCVSRKMLFIKGSTIFGSIPCSAWIITRAKMSSSEGDLGELQNATSSGNEIDRQIHPSEMYRVNFTPFWLRRPTFLQEALIQEKTLQRRPQALLPEKTLHKVRARSEQTFLEDNTPGDGTRRCGSRAQRRRRWPEVHVQVRDFVRWAYLPILSIVLGMRLSRYPMHEIHVPQLSQNHPQLSFASSPTWLRFIPNGVPK